MSFFKHQIMRARATLDVRALAPLVQCPTLVLHAEGDQIVPVALGRDLAAAIPGARFVTLPTRNHIPPASDAGFELFCRTVAARLSLADKTVRNALSALYAALQVEGRRQARTRELGLGGA